MNYTTGALIGMVSYGVTVVLLKMSFRTIPPEVVLVVTNVILVAGGAAFMVYRGESLLEHVGWSRSMLYILAAGATLTVGIAAYYIALSRGPASVVTPIFAMNFAVASILGMLFLNEAVNAQKLAGLALACGAIVLLTR